MSCSWCEEEKELAGLCNNESHRVCKECYGKYRAAYPLRVEGCPYCKGTEEKVVIQIEIPEEVELPAVYIPEEVEIPEEVHMPNTVVYEEIPYYGCDTHQVSTTIATAFIILLLMLLIIRSYG